MALKVDLRHRQGDFTLEASFESSGRLTALLGPSGSGKTTVINLIGGLARPKSGRIVIGERVLVDTAKGVFLPPHRRRVGYVFQDARLFPHMTVRQNLRYGRFFTPRSERYAEIDRVVELLGIGHLLERRPSLLSGGEKQRVAIGRALIASPRLILMDEPLASLDDARKAEIIPYIERLRDEAGIPIVYVSHSIAEVARLASEVAVLAEGRLAAFGPTSEILQRLDLLPVGERREGGAVLDMVVKGHDERYGLTTLASPAGEVQVTRLDAGIGAVVHLRIRASDVMVATARPEGLSALNILAGRITSLAASSGATVDVRIDCNGEALLARITRRSTERLGLAQGMPVFAIVKTMSLEGDTLGGGGAR